MTSYLCISVTFLDPLYHGRLNGDRTAEWPPSPLRLYQALLAGAGWMPQLRLVGHKRRRL